MKTATKRRPGLDPLHLPRPDSDGRTLNGHTLDVIRSAVREVDRRWRAEGEAP